MNINWTNVVFFGCFSIAMNRALAQEDTPEFNLHSACKCSHTYRELISPLYQKTVRDQLRIDSEQLSVLTEMRDNLALTIPSFSLLENDASGVKEFFDRVERSSRNKDKSFARFFDEGLLPAQSEALIGIYLVANGIEGFRHEKIQTFFAVSESQVKTLEKSLANRQQLRRKMWTSFSSFVAGSQMTREELARTLDLRHSKSLSESNTILNDEQLQLLTRILKLVPARTAQRLSLGI